MHGDHSVMHGDRRPLAEARAMHGDPRERDSGLTLADAARRVVWWQPPKATLKQETLFLNHAMRWGTPEVLAAVRHHYGDDRFRQALRDALPGVFDRRSWAYWHLALGMGEAPPLPIREIPGVDPADMPRKVWPEDYRHRR